MTSGVAATVNGATVLAQEVDSREGELRATTLDTALPRRDTSEGRQLRRWLTQVLVTERVVAAEAEALGLTADGAPTEAEVLPDTTARLEIGSVAAAVLRTPLTRVLFRHVTAEIEVSAADVSEYHCRNPFRFGGRAPGADGWRGRPVETALDEVRPAITAHLLAAARRREFRRWLDARRAELVTLAPGYEHPGDPRQPDNTHKH